MPDTLWFRIILSLVSPYTLLIPRTFFAGGGSIPAGKRPH